MSGPDGSPGDDTLDVVADLAQLAAVGRFVRERCGDHPRAALLELAVHELLVNATRHGGARRCRIGIRSVPNGLEVEVADDGAPFDATRAAIRPMGDLRESGYGLGIVHAIVDRLSYAHRDGWNRLTLGVAP